MATARSNFSRARGAVRPRYPEAGSRRFHGIATNVGVETVLMPAKLFPKLP
jgi:hypothetical protein